MHISREPVILKQQISLFGKKFFFINYDFHGYCEVLNMKLNMWLDIPSKYIEDCSVTVSVPVGIFRKVNWHILSRVFFVFGISLGMVKTYVKNVIIKSLFVCLFVFCGTGPQMFFYLRHLLATYLFGFVFKIESCPLCFDFLTDLCYAYKLHAEMLFIIW